MEDIFITFRNMLHVHFGMGATMLTESILTLSLGVMAVVSYLLAKLLLHLVAIIVDRTPTKWDDDLLTPRVLDATAQLAPALTVNWGLPLLFFDTNAGTIRLIDTLTSFYIIWAVVRLLTILTGNLYVAMSHRESTRAYAVKGIFQTIKLVIIGGGIIVALSLMLGKTPAAIVATLGASAAVLMLVFKDTIMGLVASVQLTANKMLQRGDWVVCEQHDANGEVTEISLTTVKIRNWDNSVTTIPPYAMVSQSFRNYQPMRHSGGRRVERSVYIDITSVRFADTSLETHLADRGLIEAKEPGHAAERRVNLRLYREYLVRYLSGRADVNTDMLLMVRQMPPTPSGLPVQLYFFTRTTEWEEFEKIQSDIFDHVYATAPEFGLRLFQTPAGTDLGRLANNCTAKALTK